MSTEPIQIDRYLTVREAAAALGVCRQRIHQFLQAGRISGVRTGPIWLIPTGEIRRFGRLPRKVGRPEKQPLTRD